MKYTKVVHTKQKRSGKQFYERKGQTMKMSGIIDTGMFAHDYCGSAGCRWRIKVILIMKERCHYVC